MSAKTSPTTVTSIRVHHNIIATLYNYYVSRGVKVDSKGALLNISLVDFVDILVDKDLVKPVNDIDEAILICQNLGIKMIKSRITDELMNVEIKSVKSVKQQQNILDDLNSIK